MQTSSEQSSPSPYPAAGELDRLPRPRPLSGGAGGERTVLMLSLGGVGGGGCFLVGMLLGMGFQSAWGFVLALLGLATMATMVMIGYARWSRYLKREGQEERKFSWVIVFACAVLFAETVLRSLFPNAHWIGVPVALLGGALCVHSYRLLLLTQGSFMRKTADDPVRRTLVGLLVAAVGMVSAVLQLTSVLAFGPMQGNFNLVADALLLYQTLTGVWGCLMIWHGLAISLGKVSRRAWELDEERERRRQFQQQRRQASAWFYQHDEVEREQIILERLAQGAHSRIERPRTAAYVGPALVAWLVLIWPVLGLTIGILQRGLFHWFGAAIVLTVLCVILGAITYWAVRGLHGKVMWNDQGGYLAVRREHDLFLWDEIRVIELERTWYGEFRLSLIRDHDEREFVVGTRQIRSLPRTMCHLLFGMGLPLALFGSSIRPEKWANYAPLFGHPVGPDDFGTGTAGKLASRV